MVGLPALTRLVRAIVSVDIDDAVAYLAFTAHQSKGEMEAMTVPKIVAFAGQISELVRKTNEANSKPRG